MSKTFNSKRGKHTYTQYAPDLETVLIRVTLEYDDSVEEVSEHILVEIMDSIEKYRMAGAFGMFTGG